MCRLGFSLFYLAFFVALGHACAANENSTENVQVNTNQASQKQKLKMDTEPTAAASSSSSRYKPTGLLLRIDFEKEEVKPPLKLYIGSRIIDYIRKNAGVTQLYWDDLEIYGNW